MRATILKINRSNPNLSKIRLAAETIRKGGLVVFPTETVYGIGADAMNASACRKIFKAKKRPSDNPLIVHVSDMEMAEKVAIIPRRYRKAIESIWPSPLTLILKARAGLPRVVTAGLKTVAVRMPSDEIALELIRQSRTPIAAPSANISKKPSSTSGKHAIGYFLKSVDIILDAGNSEFGIESTVLDLGHFTLLRPGAFTMEEISAAFMKKPKLPKEALGLKEAKKALSPGMKYRHYSPDTKLMLYEGDPSRLKSILSPWKGRFAFMGSGETAFLLGKMPVKSIILGSRKEPRTIARNLFSGLIYLDSLKAEFCITESFTEKGYGLAIMNRLRKASSHKHFHTAEELEKCLR